MMSDGLTRLADEFQKEEDFKREQEAAELNQRRALELETAKANYATRNSK